MTDPQLRRLLDLQSGVLSRRQLASHGVDDNDVRRLLRRRQLRRVHRGVFATHTGPLSWVQRAWSAVLFHEPAALCDVSALDLSGDVLHLAVAADRRVAALRGVRLHRMADLERRVMWNATPPRLRVEEAALDVGAGARTRVEAVAVLTEVCQRRRSTPARLLAALDARPRIRDREWLRKVLLDAADGAVSVLEQAHLRRVERAHGLPRGIRQRTVRTVDGVRYRDVDYEEFGLLVELDGRAWHDDPHVRADDMDRDLVSAVEGRLTIRLGYRQVVAEPCVTAERQAALLRAGGSTGAPRRCGRECALQPLRGAFQSPGA